MNVYAVDCAKQSIYILQRIREDSTDLQNLQLKQRAKKFIFKKCVETLILTLLLTAENCTQVDLCLQLIKSKYST